MKIRAARATLRTLSTLGRSIAAFAATVAAFAAVAAGGDIVPPDVGPSTGPPSPWEVTSLYSHSALSGGRPAWDIFDAWALSRVTPQLQIGAFVDAQRRPPDTDVGYGANFSWYPVRTLEWRGAAMLVPEANFLPRQTYGSGLEWRTGALASVAADYKRQNFSEGPIDQVTPAFTLWFNDDTTWITGRYTYGRAYAEQNFHSFGVVVALGMPNQGRLTLGYANGADPEKDPGIPGVILTNATNYAAYYRALLFRGISLIIGAEYEDRPGIYTKTTGSVGFDAKF